MAKVIFDATQETLYPLAKPGFSGGSQTYARAIIKALVRQGHTVHVIAPDMEGDEQRGEREFWWSPLYHPHKADIAIMQMHVYDNPQYEAPLLILATSCVDPNMGPNHEWARAVDAVPVFSEVHKQLLMQQRPIPAEKIFVTGLGVDLDEFDIEPYRGREYTSFKVPGRMLYANDPARGLFTTLDIFDEVKKQVPEATLHVAYDFDTQFSWRQWEHSQMAQYYWECKRRLEGTPGVVKTGNLDRAGIIREQLECQVHCMPSDPPGVGTQTHGLTQMECAAAGAALVLSDIEAFPEVFAEWATILPTIGKYLPEIERRVTAADYAAVVAKLMLDPLKWAKESAKARILAEQNTWEHVARRWAEMIAQLTGKEEAVV